MLYLLLFLLAWVRASQLYFHAQTPAHVRLMDRLGLDRDHSKGVFVGDPRHTQTVRDAGVDVRVHTPGDFDGYHDNDAIERDLRAFVERSNGEFLRVGESVQGRTLHAARLGPRRPGVPKILYMGGIHGDEVVGPELVLFFATHLLDNDRTGLMNNTEVYLLPRLNPDGFALQQRANANGVDLNRNFPDRYVGEDAADKFPYLGSAPRQTETQAIMTFLDGLRPDLAVVMHGGSTVCNYPYDGNAAGVDNPRARAYAAAPDDALYREVCSAYAEHNRQMTGNRLFEGGITNGAAWYVLYGGLQDWLYLNSHTVSVTTEVSDDKWPRGATVFANYAPFNLASMTAFGNKALQGLRGRVTDEHGHPVSGAAVKVESGAGGLNVFTDSDGYFVRMLPIGHHSLSVSSPGYVGQRVEVPVVNGEGYVRNFALQRQ